MTLCTTGCTYAGVHANSTDDDGWNGVRFTPSAGTTVASASVNVSTDLFGRSASAADDATLTVPALTWHGASLLLTNGQPWAAANSGTTTLDIGASSSEGVQLNLHQKPSFISTVTGGDARITGATFKISDTSKPNFTSGTLSAPGVGPSAPVLTGSSTQCVATGGTDAGSGVTFAYIYKTSTGSASIPPVSDRVATSAEYTNNSYIPGQLSGTFGACFSTDSLPQGTTPLYLGLSDKGGNFREVSLGNIRIQRDDPIVTPVIVPSGSIGVWKPEFKYNVTSPHG